MTARGKHCRNTSQAVLLTPFLNSIKPLGRLSSHIKSRHKSMSWSIKRQKHPEISSQTEPVYPLTLTVFNRLYSHHLACFNPANAAKHMGSMFLMAWFLQKLSACCASSVSTPSATSAAAPFFSSLAGWPKTCPLWASVDVTWSEYQSSSRLPSYGGGSHTTIAKILDASHPVPSHTHLHHLHVFLGESLILYYVLVFFSFLLREE